MQQLIVFQHVNMHGAHKHFFTSEPNFNAGDDNFFNDIVSSIVVVEGRWQFYMHSNFVSPVGPVLGPGIYSWVEAIGIPNDQVSSVRYLGQ